MMIPVLILQLKDRTDLSDNEKTSKALFAMVFFGVGEIFGGLMMGLFIDKFGSKCASVKNIILVMMMVAITYYNIYNGEYNYLSFMMTFMWGYMDGALNIHCFQICGF